jgi:uncharacterized membrane protein
VSEAASKDDGRITGSRIPALARVLAVFTAGALAFAVAIFLTAWQAATLVGWDVAAVVFIAWVWRSVAGKDSAATAAFATTDDRSRPAADLILIAVSGATLVVVALALLEASREKGAAEGFITAVAGVSVVLSWATVNTVFTLRYASLYYLEGGGINFYEDRQPDYGDFAYVALTIGMTYQVSDTAFAARSIRMTALRHALLSFVFVTSVVAMTINVVAGLFTG